MSVVAENVERIISETGMKKGAVAKKAGLGVKAFSAMLHGRKMISAEHVIYLSRALGCTPNELYGFSAKSTERTSCKTLQSQG